MLPPVVGQAASVRSPPVIHPPWDGADDPQGQVMPDGLRGRPLDGGQTVGRAVGTSNDLVHASTLGVRPRLVIRPLVSNRAGIRPHSGVLLVGEVLMVMAVARVGRYARYMPTPVVEGFTVWHVALTQCSARSRHRSGLPR